jgi:hypothetical protein
VTRLADKVAFATSGIDPPDRVSAALTAAAFLVLALLVTRTARPRRSAAPPAVDELPAVPDFTAADADALARTAA